MRGVLGLVASALAGLAAIVASLDGEGDIVPFFVGLTFAGGLAAWAAHPPFAGMRRRVAQFVAVAWLVAACWVGVLLVMSLTLWQGSSSPPPIPEATYVGLPATSYHLVGLYAGAVFVLLLAFGRASWLGDSITATTAEPARP
jgi:hypothetical protein